MTAPSHKKANVSDSITVEQEQLMVDFFNDHSEFYDQTLKEFKDRGRKDHLLAKLGVQIGLSGKCTNLLPIYKCIAYL